MSATKTSRRRTAKPSPDKGGDELTRLTVTGELTVGTATDQAGVLLSRLAELESPTEGRELMFDLTEVPELDTAGLQILLLLRREARARGWRTTMSASEPVDTVLALAGLTSQNWQE